MTMLDALALALFASAIPTLDPPREDEPLRVFLRAGPKTHGPGEHDHPLFLERWSVLLRERGCAVEGALRFPSEEELARADPPAGALNREVELEPEREALRRCSFSN